MEVEAFELGMEMVFGHCDFSLCDFAEPVTPHNASRKNVRSDDDCR